MTGRRLHIDVTSLWDAGAPPVGITRMVTELARAIRIMSEHNQAWRYDRRARRMRKVGWEELEGLVRFVPPERKGVPAARLWLRQSRFARLFWRAALSSLRQAYRTMIESTGVRTIFCCHDLIPILFRQFVGADTARCFEGLLLLFSRAEAQIWCISHRTASDMQSLGNRLDLPFAEPIIIPPGCDLQQARSLHSDGQIPSVEQPYILYVSTIEARKNHGILLQAYQQLLDRGRSDLPRLVFVGRRGWLVDDLLKQLDSGVGVSAHVRIMEKMSDAELRALYRSALFTVFPSFYEGWGIPVTEALSLGKLCLSSNRGALPEAGAGFAELLDPDNVAQWADRIAHYLDHPEELAQREEAIRKGFRPRLWSHFRQDAMKALALG